VFKFILYINIPTAWIKFSVTKIMERNRKNITHEAKIRIFAIYDNSKMQNIERNIVWYTLLI
ncbi:hypothetical protein, partial [Clostridium sp.]|uniref:hypothetical protein n=1 Tax=Clostridium sp. TaxID=1506 RepID=UPI0025B7F56B